MKAESMNYPKSISVDYIENGLARLNCCMNINEVIFTDENDNEQTKYVYDHTTLKWAMPSASHIIIVNGKQTISPDGLAYLTSIEDELLGFAAAKVMIE